MLVQRYKGDCGNLIDQADKDAMKLLDFLVEAFPSFQDKSIYRGMIVFFFKRAQVFISDVYQIFRDKNYRAIKNVENLTAAADYKLPQILREQGILSYSSELAKKIDNRIPIPSNSIEEVEIRANTIWAVEFIKQELNIPQITSMTINDYLWLLAQEKSLIRKPYHMTESDGY